MKNPFLTGPAYQAFRKDIHHFVAQNIKPYAQEWEQTTQFPDHLLQLLAREGYIGLSLPRSVGGQGKDFWHEVIMAEEIARGGALGWVVSLLVQTNVAALLLYELGTKDQHQTVLKPALDGAGWLALGLTEPISGSHLAGAATTATVKDDQFVVEGEKRYITNGTIADHLIVLANIENHSHGSGLGLLVIPADTKGITRDRLPTAGFKTGDTAVIHFKNCQIAQTCLLGKPKASYLALLKALQRERLISAVAVNAVSQQVLDQTIEFLKTRQRFGEPLIKKQTIRHRVAELAARVEASRQCTYAVCHAFAQGQPVDTEIVMLKITAFETSQDVIRECIQLHGAEGFLETHWLQHVYRDSQAFTIAGGTSEIMRELLASMLLD
jgi:acyl-CoA dehydrogenase